MSTYYEFFSNKSSLSFERQKNMYINKSYLAFVTSKSHCKPSIESPKMLKSRIIAIFIVASTLAVQITNVISTDDQVYEHIEKIELFSTNICETRDVSEITLRHKALKKLFWSSKTGLFMNDVVENEELEERYEKVIRKILRTCVKEITELVNQVYFNSKPRGLDEALIRSQAFNWMNVIFNLTIKEDLQAQFRPRKRVDYQEPSVIESGLSSTKDRNPLIRFPKFCSNDESE